MRLSSVLPYVSMSASVLLLSSLLSACDSSPDPVDNQMQQKVEAQRLQDELALQAHLKEVGKPITEANNPELYQQWGSEWIEIINNMLPLAIERVNDHPQCDKVMKAEIAESSIQGKNPILNISCQNGENYFVGLNDIANQIEPTPASELFGRGSNDYIQLCKEKIAPEMQFPESIQHDVKKTKVSVNKLAREVDVLLPFKVKTAYDTEVSHVVSCKIDSKTQTPKVIQIIWQ